MKLDGLLVGRIVRKTAEAVRLDHEIACPSENELYVGELLNWRMQKLTLKPGGRP